MDREFEIYFDDLTEEAQQRLKEAMGWDDSFCQQHTVYGGWYVARLHTTEEEDHEIQD